MSSLSTEQKDRLITLAQEGIPLVERPFAALGEQAGVDEAAALEAIGQALEDGLIREISGIFEARAIGYHSTLAAMRVPDEGLDEAAAVVSAHPGVSHNYARQHPINLWFTLAVPAAEDIRQELSRLAEASGGWPHYYFPTLRTFKIGVRFSLGADDSASASGAARKVEPLQVDEHLKTIIRALQHPLPLIQRPFDRIAGQHGLQEGTLLEEARRLKEHGALRRYAAVVRHRAAGYRGNIMSAWDVAPEDLEEAAAHLSSLSAVSHCYERPTYPDWPFALFAMVHARTEEACREVIQNAAEVIRPRKLQLLKSVREYKKQRVRYYTGSLSGS